MSTSLPSRALQVVRVHPDDVRAAPLFAELAVEYDTRYGDLFGGASEELTRYPAEAFLPPDGDFVLLLEGGRAVAGGAFMRHPPAPAEAERMWPVSHHPRRGLPRRVLAQQEHSAAAVGYRRMYLTPGPRQPEARDLYLAAGWTPLFDPAVPRPTDTETLRALPVDQRLYAFEKDLS